jgi:CubicO group peptidase (beta-lactamase class C family)
MAAQDVPATGAAVSSLAAFDQGMLALLKKYDVPGGSLAVMRDGRLILARGYGFADVENKVPVQPDSLFRLASVSKTVTAIGVMKLVEQGKLSLDKPALELLDSLKPAPGQTITPAFTKVTVRHLLWHAGGWDRDKVPGGYDPMFQSSQVTRALGVPSPAACTDVIRWMLSRPLDNDPGQKYAYSNFGYCILGRIVEKVSGKPYETFIRQEVLAPVGIGRMWIGSSLPRGRRPGEVIFYDAPDAARVSSVFPELPGLVPAPYGAWDLRTLDSHGGWIGSAIDIARLIKAIDFDLPGSSTFLKKESIQQMLARPAAPIASPSDAAFYGFGMRVRPGAGNGNWWHTGSLPGTATQYVRDGRDRMAWVILLNRRAGRELSADLDRLGWNAVAKVASFPSGDLFPQYPSRP